MWTGVSGDKFLVADDGSLAGGAAGGPRGAPPPAAGTLAGRRGGPGSRAGTPPRPGARAWKVRSPPSFCVRPTQRPRRADTPVTEAGARSSSTAPRGRCRNRGVERQPVGGVSTGVARRRSSTSEAASRIPGSGPAWRMPRSCDRSASSPNPTDRSPTGTGSGGAGARRPEPAVLDIFRLAAPSANAPAVL